MTIFNIISSYGSWLIALAILENIFMIFIIIESIVYFFKYKKIDKIIKEIKEDGRE